MAKADTPSLLRDTQILAYTVKMNPSAPTVPIGTNGLPLPVDVLTIG